MPSHTLPLFAAALTLALAACSPQPTDPANPPEGVAATDPADATTMPPAAGAADDALQPTAPGMGDPCDASVVQSLIGQEATEEVVEQARIDAGAETARTLRPDQAVTMEFREGRLNVDVDENGTVTSLRCG